MQRSTLFGLSADLRRHTTSRFSVHETTFFLCDHPIVPKETNPLLTLGRRLRVRLARFRIREALRLGQRAEVFLLLSRAGPLEVVV